MIRFRQTPQNPQNPQTTSRRCALALAREVLVHRLADEMREMAFSGESVTEGSLNARGWRSATVKRLVSRAVARARRDSLREAI